MSHALSTARRVVEYVRILERDNRQLRKIRPLKGSRMRPSVPVPAVVTLLDRYARKEHARMAWIQRDQEHTPRHHGEFDACSHPECIETRAAIGAVDAKP